MWAIYKKELGSFYRSMMGYLYTAFFLVVSGIFFTAFNLRGGMAEFGYVLGNTMVVLMVVVPVLTMRSLGAERRQKTDQLLFTSPVKTGSIVLGKFLAVLTIFLSPFAALVFCPLILSRYGTVPLAQSYSCFLAFGFMGAACIAVGIFISALTENQIVAAVGTFAVMLASYLSGGIRGLIGGGAVLPLRWLAAVLKGLAVFGRYYDFAEGLFDVRHLVYYAGIIILFLVWSVWVLERRVGRGKYMGMMSVLVFLAVLLCGRIAGRLPASLMQIDTSASRLYSISRQTKELVGGLDTEVELYLIAPEGQEDEKLVRLLEKYRDLSPRLSISYVDPVLQPSFVPSYTTDRVSDNSILVVGEKRFQLVRNSDLYPSNYDYDTGKITTDFDGEGQITSAIHYVTEEVLEKIYLVAGHGEAELTESFGNALEKEGITWESLNLTAAARVPEDAASLWMNVPVSDLTEQERQVLEAYLEQGGHLLLITGITAAGMPNLAHVLAGYGLEAVQGMIVERDGNLAIPSYPNFLLPMIRTSPITEPFLADNRLLLLPNAHGIGHTGEVRKTVEVQELLTTSQSSYLKTDTANLEFVPGDAAGPFAVGITAWEETSRGQARIAWFSSGNLLTDEIDGMVGGSNTDLVLNAIGWLNGKSDSFSIRPKVTGSETLRLNAAQAAKWSMLYVGVLPCLILAAGILVVVRRKKQQ